MVLHSNGSQTPRSSRFQCFAPFIPTLPAVKITFPILNMKHGEQNNSEPPHDPVVDISDMYSMMVRLQDIEEGYFITCQSHRDTIEQQIELFKQLASDEKFWVFIADKRRKARMPLHLKIETFIKWGIPPKFRAQMWLVMSGTFPKTKVLSDIYANLFLYQKAQESTISEIERDVGRTFPALGEPAFVKRLTNVLTAYSLRNPQLGYCQAMNFIAGTLLIFMEEEPAFWMLVYIVEELLSNYFIPSMSGLLADTQVFDWLVSIHLPELYAHFRRVHLSMSMFTTSWFLCLFINYIPTETCFLVWDNIMLDGISVVFEVGLAILRMHKEDLMRHEDQLELTVCLRDLCANLHDPKKLWANWQRIDKTRLTTTRQQIQRKVEAESGKKNIAKMINELEHRTHFVPEDLIIMWSQYISIDSFLKHGAAGLDHDQFAQFVGGTFSEWEVDCELVDRLFALSDVNMDGSVDFTELMLLLSVVCRGTFRQKVNFNFHLFDVNSKGRILKFDLYRMLQSVYCMFVEDESFHNLLRFFVDMIFEAADKNTDGSISIHNFDDVVSIQPQIMHRFKARNPHVKYDLKKTYYYWMFDTDRPNRHSEIINITLDRKATTKLNKLPMHVVLVGSRNSFY